MTVPKVSGRARARPAWPRFLPPVRLVWISLAVLGAYGVYALHGLGYLSLLALPLLAVLADLGFQSARFPRIRFPDAALVTGLFLGLLLPPSVSLVLAGAVTFAAIGVRHALRFEGHPFFNPAVTAVVLGAVIFGLAPAWWVAIGPFGEYLMVGLGLLLLVRSPRAWRIPLGFFVAYGLAAAVVQLLVSTTLNTNLLWLTLIDPAVIFFGLYMVTEPRTAPSNPLFQGLYGGGVGLGAIALSLYFPSLGVLIALLLVNLVAVAGRVAHSLRVPHRRPSSRKGSTKPKSIPAGPARWPIAVRVGAVFLVLVVLMGAAALSPNAYPQPILAPPGGGGGGHGGGGGGGGGGVTNCVHDNSAIPSSTLSSLHQILGPSVILSDNPNTGVVVFYDPVNHVTVTESDLYEDFGYAEFNGDDYAVNGCHP